MEINKKIQRIPYDGAVAGVCAGLGEYFGVDKTWIRVGFIFTVFFAGSGIGFVGPLLYVILWIVLPIKPVALSDDPYHVDYRATSPDRSPSAKNDDMYADSYRSYGQQGASAVKKTRKSKSDKTTAGIILLGIGIFFLLHQFDVFYWRDLIDYWPVLLIFMGLVNIVTAFTGSAGAADVPPAAVNNEKESDFVDDSEGSDTSGESRQE